MLRDRVKCAVANPGVVNVGSVITLGASPTGFRTWLSAFGAAQPAYFVLSDGAGRALSGVWTVNNTTPATATITQILMNDRLGTTAGETFSSACVAFNAVPSASPPGQVLAQANAAAMRTALGATTVGAALMTTADATAARTTLGATTTGDALFIAASAAAGRTTLGAAPTPQTATGVGQRVRLESGAGNSLSLPASGTWDWFAFALSSTGAVTSFNASVSAGGSLIASAGAGINVVGAAWRVA